MVSSPMRQIAFASTLLAVAGLLSMAAAGSATGASQPAQRRLAATSLSDFKVVLTATREPGHPPLATVTAAGYRRSGGRWQPIATRRIGKASGWFWFSVQTCSLTTTQLKNNTVSTSPPVVTSDSIKVSLLVTPAIGCSRAYRTHWTPRHAGLSPVPSGRRPSSTNAGSATGETSPESCG
jgi:hypothetical protein